MKGVTDYQYEVIKHVGLIAKETGKLADFDQVLERLSWRPSKDAAQFTVRACIAKGLLEKAPLEHRRGRKRVCYELSEEGRKLLDPRIPASALPDIEELSGPVPVLDEVMED